MHVNNILTPHNTFNLESTCSALVTMTSRNQLSGYLARASRYVQPALVLGYGSNVVLPSFYAGMVILNRLDGCEVLFEDNDSVVVRVGAGRVWHDFVQAMLLNGWYGLENLAMIPGSVGAAPVQNIGAYGVEVAQVLRTCEVYCRQTNQVLELSAAQCGFSYRNSIFKSREKGRYVILSVVFQLHKTYIPMLSYQRLRRYLGVRSASNPSAQDVFDAVCAIRSQRLPAVGEVGTVGSFFVNPVITDCRFRALQARFLLDLDYCLLEDGRVKLFAGNLLTRLGWRGFSQGQFCVSEKNAIVLLHKGGGGVLSLLSFVEAMRQSVWSVFAISLEVEPEFIAASPISVSV